MPTGPSPNSETDQLLEAIARRILRVPTLEMRGDDRRDIYEIAVWDLAQALREAFEAGRCARGSDFPNNQIAQPPGSSSTPEARPQNPETIIPLLRAPCVWVVARNPRLVTAGQNPGQGSCPGSGSNAEAYWDGQAWRTSADRALPFRSFSAVAEFIEMHRRRLETTR